MRSRNQAVNWFLGALAVGAAAGALVRHKPQPIDAPADGAPARPPTRKQWAGSLMRTLRHEVRENETIVISAALAFYAMLALVPAMIAAMSIYGLVLDRDTLADQIETITNVLPASTEQLVADQLTDLAAVNTTGLSVGLVFSLIGALWVASSGTRSLLHGINLVYNVRDRRAWARQRALAYVLTLGFILFGVATVALVTFLPGLLENIGLGTNGRQVIEIARWPGILSIVVLGLAVLYRIAPNRPGVRAPLLFPGAVGAAVLWLLATAAFSIYVGSGFNSLNDTYGVLVSAVVLLLWFFVSGFAVLLGAEINDTLEKHRTSRPAPLPANVG
jgi:membrane protein